MESSYTSILDALDDWVATKASNAAAAAAAAQSTVVEAKTEPLSSAETPRDALNAHRRRRSGSQGAQGAHSGGASGEDLARTASGSTATLATSTTLGNLSQRVEACDQLLAVVDQALSDLTSLETQHQLVSDKTETLHEECTRLLHEQAKLDKIVASLQGPMSYFESLDEIGPRVGLVLPSELAVRRADPTKPVKILHPDDAQFKRDLARLDECLAFVAAHPRYFDHAAYEAKFEQLQRRMLTMIRNWVVDEIIKTTDSVQAATSKQMSAQQLQQQKPAASSNGAVSNSSLVPSSRYVLDDPLLYRRFIEKGHILRSSIEELEKRALAGGASGLLHQCVSTLCYSRARLVRDLIAKSEEMDPRMNQGTPASSQLVTMILRAGDFLARVCEAEHGLFSSYFNLSAGRKAWPSESDASKPFADPATAVALRHKATGASEPFAEYLISICSCLHDTLRPFIVRESDLEILCDAVSSVQTVVAEAKASMTSRDALEPLEAVLLRISDDAQERLVFCAIKSLRDTVNGYSPTPEDLAYPEKLTSSDSSDSWYPSLLKTLSVLSNVYRAVDPIVFQHLANEAVSACTSSLLDASKRVAKRPGNTQDDGDLFLIKHLLILREQISPFRAVLAHKEQRLEFGLTAAALVQLFRRGHPEGGAAPASAGGASSNRRDTLLKIVKRLSVPIVRESEVDTKRELDGELRRASEAFIHRTAVRALGGLHDVAAQTDAYLAREGASQAGLAKQDFCSKSKLEEAVRFVLESQKDDPRPRILRVVDEARLGAAKYLPAPQTRDVLFGAIEMAAFRVVNRAANLAAELYKEDADLQRRCQELVRRVGELRKGGGGLIPAESNTLSAENQIADAAAPPAAAADENRASEAT